LCLGEERLGNERGVVVGDGERANFDALKPAL
jgi:hypothetical protein